jgi:hypothetical protein
VPILAMLEAALFLDAVFNWRWILHEFLAKTAVANGVYGQRSLPQVLGLLALSGMASYALTLACLRLRGKPGAILAIFGGVFSAVLWLVEVVSLHATDVALQAQLGPIMAIAVVWALSSAATALGVEWDSLSCEGIQFSKLGRNNTFATNDRQAGLHSQELRVHARMGWRIQK